MAFFFYCLGEKSPARMAKVPAAILDPGVGMNISGTAHYITLHNCIVHFTSTMLY